MFSRTALSAAAGHALRPRRNPLLSSRFAALQRSFLSTETRQAIDKAVASAPVVLFMKGTPETPQCGFSRASIQILGLQGVNPQKFTAFNVLEDEELRQGIKEYSEWPTIPQLYVEKEFVGGTDIMMSMHQDGSLAKLLEEKDVLVPAESDPPSSSTLNFLHDAPLTDREELVTMAELRCHRPQKATVGSALAAAVSTADRRQEVRKSYSITGLLEQAKKLKRKLPDEEDYTNISAHQAGSKRPALDPDFIKKLDQKQLDGPQVAQPNFFRKADRKDTPLKAPYFNFADAFKSYTTHTAAAFSTRLDDWHKTRSLRLAGLASTGEPLPGPPIPTEADIAAVRQKEQALNTPLEDTIIQVELRQPGGSKTLQERRFGDTLDKALERAGRKREQVRDVEGQIEAIKREIGVLTEDVTKETGKEDAELERQVKELEGEIRAAEEQAVADRVAFGREQREWTRAFNRGIQNLMACDDDWMVGRKKG